MTAPRGNAETPSILNLYIDSLDTEEIIDGNLALYAKDHGFTRVDNRGEADVVLVGAAGVLGKPSWFETCIGFYSFEVVIRRPKARRVGRLSLRIPNDVPCIRSVIANRILSQARERVDSINRRVRKQP